MVQKLKVSNILLLFFKIVSSMFIYYCPESLENESEFVYK